MPNSSPKSFTKSNSACTEEEIDRLAENCFDSHRKLTSELFHRYLNEEVSGSPELQAELMRMQETVDRYRDVLDDLQEQD